MRSGEVEEVLAAVEAGILTADDSDVKCAVYRYVEPANPTARMLISLLA